MKTYKIDVAQTIITTVSVDAPDEAAAVKQVDDVDFPLPPRDEWSHVKGSFEYEVLNGDDEQPHVCQDPAYGPCPRPECGAPWR